LKKASSPRANVKGSLFDHRAQHDCYPFVVYNMMVFWLVMPLIGWERVKRGLLSLFREKIAVAQGWLRMDKYGLFEPEEIAIAD